MRRLGSMQRAILETIQEYSPIEFIDLKHRVAEKTHPESIYSNRIYHDNFRRSFERALKQLISYGLIFERLERGN